MLIFTTLLVRERLLEEALVNELALQIESSDDAELDLSEDELNQLYANAETNEQSARALLDDTNLLMVYISLLIVLISSIGLMFSRKKRV